MIREVLFWTIMVLTLFLAYWVVNRVGLTWVGRVSSKFFVAISELTSILGGLLKLLVYGHPLRQLVALIVLATVVFELSS